MKTITEFSGFVLKDVVAKKAALLTEGKTEEEAQAAINEQLKLDETKSSLYKNVVDMTSSRMDRVKRVVVAVRATETEKVPESYMEREGHFYLIEYFPDANSRAPSRSSYSDDRGGRGGRGGSGGGGRGGNSFGDRGGSGGNRDAGGGGGRFPPRGEGRGEPRREPVGEVRPRPEGQFNTARAGEPSPVAPRAPRERRPAKPRTERPAGAPRPERGPRGPKGAGELRLVLKGQSQTMLPGSGIVEAAATTAAESNQAPSA